MIEATELIRDFGFPAFVALVLLYDKLKSNGSLLKVVENNNQLLCEIKKQLGENNGKKKSR